MLKPRTKARIGRRVATVATAGAGAVATALLAAGPASAAVQWVYDPSFCTSVNTAVQRDVSGRTVQVRYGWCDGVEYGWGRILNYNSSTDLIRFEVDVNGDRIPDTNDYWYARDRNYTAGYLVSSSSAVAFRACWVTSVSGTCNSGNATSWW